MTPAYHSLSTGKDGGERRDRRAFAELQASYRRLFFETGATRRDQEIVLSDLAAYSGYFFAQTHEKSADALREANAMRRVFARIIRLGLSPDGDLSALYRAAAAELIADQEEGVTL
ncbi:hypothetical protein K1W69_25055 [Hoeflea sp. WL0058]|uniref:Uncharacterized protein n=1 Tax=Flavimaribacter sediminis TaxID=2865987 RepID=A0AAE2ZTC8_9HYPH|nr:hypothetical protein [Flavimaribacter sediminis]MBW8640485.1 hypothetical protein [Flavimaribacter sediminis]